MYVEIACTKYRIHVAEISLDKNSPSPATEISGGINIHQCGKVRHILYIITKTGQKNFVDKIREQVVKLSLGENIQLYGILCTTMCRHVHARLSTTHWVLLRSMLTSYLHVCEQ